MAEVILRIGDDPRPEGSKDGDCLCAFTDRQIGYVHAQHICHPRLTSRFQDGMCDPAHHMHEFLRKTCRYQYEQVSSLVAEKTDLVTMQVEEITGPEYDISIQGSAPVHVNWVDIHRSPLPPRQAALLDAANQIGLNLPTVDKEGNQIVLRIAGVPVPYTLQRSNDEFMRVGDFVRRRRRHNDRGKPLHKLFKVGSNVRWFGGHNPNLNTPALIDDVWAMIEGMTSHRRSTEGHSLWPMGRLDIRSFLGLRLDSMDEAQAEEMTEPQLELSQSGDPVWVLNEGPGGEITHEGDDPPDERPWQRKIKSQRNVSIDWVPLLGDLGVSRTQVEDMLYPVGNEVTITGDHEIAKLSGNLVRYESKDQPLQNRQARMQRKHPTAGRGPREARVR